METEEEEKEKLEDKEERTRDEQNVPEEKKG